MRLWRNLRLRNRPDQPPDQPNVVKSEKGQATVLIGMMMMTFVLFLAFVINTGMLVNARINLQNAADMAAYAGAAVQARQLTQISFLNYEMRRQYKKFLFRYYVMGNLAQKDFPTNASKAGSDAYDFSPTGKPEHAYNVPSVCLAFNSSNNYCQNFKLDSTMKKDYAAKAKLDLMNSTLYGMVQKIEATRQENCVSNGRTNKQILLLWLFNSDNNAGSLSTNDPSFSQTAKSIEVLTEGLGLVPRLTLLGRRIKTMENFVNFKPERGVSIEKADHWRGEIATSAQRERVLQAYYSAYRTLGPHAFPGGDIQVDELLPEGPSGSNLLNLTPVVGNFDAYALEMAIGECGETLETPPDASVKDCLACPSPFQIQNVTLGFSKKPDILTYYAVRVKARARVLFSIFGDMKMSAYAAARPFGSRIGPLFPQDAPPEFFALNSNPSFCSGGDCSGKVPNLPIISPTEPQDMGWNTKDALYQFYNKMKSEGDTNDLAAIGAVNLRKGYQVAMLPNPSESGRYNIPHDFLAKDSTQPDYWFEEFFDEKGMMAIWAPLVEPGANVESEIEKLIAASLDTIVQVASGSQSKFDMSLFADGVKKQLQDYLSKLKQGQGEDGESINVVRIADPFRTRQNTSSLEPPGQAITLDHRRDFQLKPNEDVDRIRTSWASPKDTTLKRQGRVGYSVKFVSFRSLSGTKTTNAGGQNPSNTAPTDGQDDIIRIEH